MKRILKMLVAGMCIISVLGGISTVGNVFAADGNVIYVSDSGKDTAAGTSSTAPKKTLASAYSALGKKGGTVVVCGTLTLSNSAGFVLPSCDGEVTITSSYNGETFNLAKLVLKNKTYISGDTVFENISIESPAGNMIFCCGNNVTFGEGVKVRLTSSGSYPYIFGGTYAGKSGMTVDACSFQDYTITVNSGNWSCVRGGNYRDDGSQPMGFIGDVSVIINGGTFVGTGNSTTDLAVISITSFCGLYGDAYLEINGGSIASSIFGLGRPGSNSTRKLSSFEGDVKIKITGGRFTGTRLAAVQELMTQELEGNFTVEITGGEFTQKFTKMQGEGVKGDSRAFVSTDEAYAKLTQFAQLIYVSEGGDDSASGGPESPKKTLSAAIDAISGEKGAVIVIKDSASLDAYKRSDEIVGGLHIMGADGAKLNISGENAINAEISIENITIDATAALLSAAGNSITAGEGITVNGSLILDCGEGASSRVLTVYSGTYKMLTGGSATDGHTAVVIYGGSAESVYGASGARTEGDASVIILGGNAGIVVAAQKGCKGQAGIAVYGGTVTSLSSVESGRVSGDFGIALDTENANAEIVAKSVVGKKLWANNGVAIPEGFENAGRAIFFNEDSDGDGLTPLTASYRTYRTLVDAKELGEGDCSVVVIGAVEVMENVTFPDMGGKYTVGGYFCGVNWKNAFGSTIKLGAVLSFGAETVIENVDIVSYTNSAYIAGNCNKLVVESDVVCDVNFARAITQYPSLAGGVATAGGGFGGNKASDLTVNGGTWHYVYGGSINLGSDEAAKRNVKGDISLVINDGTFLGGVAANGMNNLTGNATLTVNGGIFKCSIYGTARANDKEGQKLRITGDLTVTLNRGEFRGDILAVQRAEDITLEGTYTLTMGGGDYSRVSAIKGTDGLGNKAKCVLNVADNIDINAKLTGELTLENPIATFADPSVYYYEGWYYYTYSKDYAGKPGLWLTRATNIADLGKTEPMMVWSASQAGSDMKSLWAPQIYFLDGKWYIYATCSEEGTSEASRRFPFVWVGNGALPLDGFKLHGKIDNYDTSVHSYLSPRIIEHGGVRYLVCGGFFRAEDKVAGQKHYQRLFIGELESPTKFKTGMTVIAQPTQTWEGTGKVQILEGPFPIYAPGGTLYIAYAAGETSGNEYCTGLLKFTGTENDKLTDRSKWQKLNDPLQFMDYDNKVYSPGAMVFVRDPAGETLWGIFHVKYYPNVGYNHRILYAMPVTFEGELPVMSAPAHSDVTYQMTMNSLPIKDRMFGFSTVNTVSPSPDPFPETTANPADTDPPEDTITGEDPVVPMPGKNNLLLPVTIGAVAAAIAAVIVGIVVCGKKKK
ncbi:MAG: family 43 glycosylhydrolase [Clostridia bacterium]|nr:family 43 glycosylhydrolase [Clostridia bacterium]